MDSNNMLEFSNVKGSETYEIDILCSSSHCGNAFFCYRGHTGRSYYMREPLQPNGD